MFELKITGGTLEELAENIMLAASQFSVPGTAPKTTRRRQTARDLEPERPETQEEPAGDEEETDEELQRELNEPVEPMPETAKQVVDAGTGQPAPAATTVKMTPEDVKVAAAKLAAKDAPKLAEILKSYGAAKLSEVPKGKLADFASDVMEALG